MEKCTYRGADSRMILFLSGQVRLRSPELEPAARPKRRHSSRRSGLAAVGGAKTTGRLLIASSRAATERDRAVGSARHPEIGRAHVELQSLMRISYAVFCLKK